MKYAGSKPTPTDSEEHPASLGRTSSLAPRDASSPISAPPVAPLRTDSRLAHFVRLAPLAIAISAITGFALTRFEPLLVAVALACSLTTFVILSRPFIGLLLYAAVYLLHPGIIYPVLGSLHIERVIGILALAGMFAHQLRESRQLAVDGSRQTQLLLLVVVPVLISIPFAYWRSRAVDEFVEFLKLLAWYILIVQVIDTRRRLKIFSFLFFALVCYNGYKALSAYLSGSYVQRMGIDRAIPQVAGTGGANALGADMTITIPILLLLALTRELRWFRVLPVGATVLTTATMVVTGSRSAFLGLCGALLFLWWQSRRKLLVGLIGAAVFVAGFQVMPQQYVDRFRTIGDTELRGSSLERVTIWRKGIRMIIDRPLTGVGMGCFSTANALGYSPEGRPSYMVAHNLFVEVPAQIGIPGALVFFAFLFEVIRLNRRTKRLLDAEGSEWRFEALVLQGLAGGFVALLITGFFGGNFMRYTWYVYAALGAAIARIHAGRRNVQ